jgi:DNA-binding MarR family transcriptional regulator
VTSPVSRAPADPDRVVATIWRVDRAPGNFRHDHQTEGGGGTGHELESQLGFALHAASLAMTRLYHDLLAELDLTYPQYLVLVVLWERDGIRISDIGDRLHLDSATLTPRLKRLEQAGLVTRTRSVADERSVLVALTEAGRSRRVHAGGIPAQVDRATCLTDQQLDVLKVSLEQLRDRSAARGGVRGAVFGYQLLLV